MDQKPNKNDPKRSGPKINIVSLIIIGLVLAFLFNLAYGLIAGSGKKTEILYSQFLKLVAAGDVDFAQFSSDRVTFTLTAGADQQTVEDILTGDPDYALLNSDMTDKEREAMIKLIFDKDMSFYAGLIYDADLLPLLNEHNVNYYTAVQNSNPILNFFLTWILPIAIFYGIMLLIFRVLSKKMGGSGGGIGGFMNMGKSSAKLYNIETKTGVTFADFAGQEEAKDSLSEIVDFLHEPDKYIAIGAKQPKGALLVGAPGTGKTLLAKAVAGEAGVPFFSLSGSEFVEMYVGVGASRVRDLFKQATKQAPCIIFIDEIDAIGKTRDSSPNSNDEREQTLNQLLSEMDGFDSSKGVVIIGATNRPEILDKALLRPGRFDRRVIVEKPDLPGREAILAVHAKKVHMSGGINLRQVALATSGASGADLANMINEAALRAVRLGRKTVLQEDLMESVEVVIAGKEKKDRILSDKEKRMVSYHEVGHALAAALQKNSMPVQKITIVPRTMGSLGYTMQMPEDEKYIQTKDELLTEITTLLAGRAAEEIAFGAQTTGAQNDIERATKLARAMVAQYGMSGKFGLMSLESIESKYLEGKSVLNCSDATGAEIDKEAAALLAERYKTALTLLEANKAKLAEIAEYLFTKETITGEAFMEILNNPAAE